MDTKQPLLQTGLGALAGTVFGGIAGVACGHVSSYGLPSALRLANKVLKNPESSNSNECRKCKSVIYELYRAGKKKGLEKAVQTHQTN